MRIVSGSLKGRQIHPPASFKARPTTDYAKESLFNILEHAYELESFRVLDLFAGTGSIGYEFASRGCLSVLSVDSNPKYIEFINHTIRNFELHNMKALRTDAFRFLQSATLDYDLIFADPPYDLPGIDRIPTLVSANVKRMRDILLIVEHSRELNFTQHSCFSQERAYGKVHFSFFEFPGVGTSFLQSAT